MADHVGKTVNSLPESLSQFGARLHSVAPNLVGVGEIACIVDQFRCTANRAFHIHSFFPLP